MVKNFLVIVGVVGVVSCATKPLTTINNSENSVLISESENMKSSEVNNESMVGGWAPAFFSSFNKPELQEIVEGIQSGRISRLTISYPEPMSKLAIQIRDYLQSVANSNIQMDQYKLSNTATVSYNMSQVVVTMYFK